MFKRIDHVALLVENLDEAIALYRDRLGVDFYLREQNQGQGFEVAAFRVGDAHIELLCPTTPDSVIGGLLQKRGPGVHHIALEVEDLDERMQEVSDAGLRLTSETPARGTGGSRIAFIHPRSLMGVMLELVEPASATTGQAPERAGAAPDRAE
jgi:methylmalonyl-CoA/ethylmalonyl-CoA epimerase